MHQTPVALLGSKNPDIFKDIQKISEKWEKRVEGLEYPRPKGGTFDMMICEGVEIRIRDYKSKDQSKKRDPGTSYPVADPGSDQPGLQTPTTVQVEGNTTWCFLNQSPRQPKESAPRSPSQTLKTRCARHLLESQPLQEAMHNRVQDKYDATTKFPIHTVLKAMATFSGAAAHLRSVGVPGLVRSCEAQTAARGAAAATCLFKLVSKRIIADLRRDSVFTVCSLRLFLFRRDGKLCSRSEERAPVTPAPKFGAWQLREVSPAVLLGVKPAVKLR
ncbi:hypothetical protein ABVT39_025712 [Epinephelus coioides]